MFQWRLKLREARQALAAGRVEEARRMLDEDDLREFLPAKQLAGQVAAKYAERAQKRIAWGETSAGLADLEAAEELAGANASHEAIRHEYTRTVVQQALAKLAAGEPQAAGERLQRAQRRGARLELVTDLQRIGAGWAEARRLAKTGEMAAALEKLNQAHRLADSLAAAHRRHFSADRES